MKKAYIAPKSTGYMMEAIAPIAESGNHLTGTPADRVPMSGIEDGLDNQFTKNNNAWDDKW